MKFFLPEARIGKYSNDFIVKLSPQVNEPVGFYIMNVTDITAFKNVF